MQEILEKRALEAQMAYECPRLDELEFGFQVVNGELGGSNDIDDVSEDDIDERD